MNDDTDTDLLRNRTVNTVIVDFSNTNDLKHERNLACKSILILIYFRSLSSNRESLIVIYF